MEDLLQVLTRSIRSKLKKIFSLEKMDLKAIKINKIKQKKRTEMVKTQSKASRCSAITTRVSDKVLAN